MKKRLFKKRDDAKKGIPARITNETVAEHRERILAGGRRFKYPVQYARHRLVFNTIIIALLALIAVGLIGWWQLYPAQNTSTFFYRITRAVPLPVASVDGELVRYGDYLMYYNSSAHYLQRNEQLNLESEEGKRQVAVIKRKALDTVIADAYAAKRARELEIVISNDQVNQVIDDDRTTVNGHISQETYDASALNILGWSPEEYRQDIKSKLLRQEVAYAIDEVAKQAQQQADVLVAGPNADFDKIAADLTKPDGAKVVSGISGLVPHTNSDGGLSKLALSLEKGQVSSVIRTTTGDGYYYVKLLEKTDTQLSYAFLSIPLTQFDQKIAELKNSQQVKEYISVPQPEGVVPTQ